MFNTEVIHIEISSKCVLKCPRCPRTELKLDSVNKEISLDDFKIAFDSSTLKLIDKFVFCGDIGDPIYATEFIPIVKYLKGFGKKVNVVTNGSYKTSAWWQELGSLLTEDDKVTFSVDGWDQTSNNMYRVNNNFDSIANGIKTLRSASNCTIMWSCIYFSFNEKHTDKIKNLAKNLGCNEIQFVKSSKFDGDYSIDGFDLLKPEEQYTTPIGQTYVKEKIALRDSKTIKIVNNTQIHPWAKCLNWQKELFVNVEGLVFPCPWFSGKYQDNPFVTKHRSKLNIKLRSLEQVLNDTLWDEFLVGLNESPVEICKIKCKNAQQ